MKRADLKPKRCVEGLLVGKNYVKQRRGGGCVLGVSGEGYKGPAKAGTPNQKERRRLKPGHLAERKRTAKAGTPNEKANRRVAE